MAHLTYEPIWSKTTGVVPDKKVCWNTASLVADAARAVFDFADYVTAQYSVGHPEKADDVRAYKRCLEEVLEKMKKTATCEAENLAAHQK